MDGSEVWKLLRQGRERLRHGEIQEARAVFGNAVGLAENDGDAKLLASALLHLATVEPFDHLSLPEIGRVLDLVERALALVADASSAESELLAEGLALKSVLIARSGRMQDAMVTARSAVATARLVDAKPWILEGALGTLGLLALEAGQGEEAKRAAAERVDLCQRMGTQQRECYAHLQLVEAAIRCGDSQSALASLAEARRLAAPRLAQGRAPRLRQEFDRLEAEALRVGRSSK